MPAGVFDGVHYVALGHLHGAQRITDRVRYSGSPLAYSFSETNHRKSMWLVDLDAEGGVTAERLDCPVPRPSPGSGGSSTCSWRIPRWSGTRRRGSRRP